MKSFKPLLFAIAALCFGQFAKAQTTFNFNAGLNFSNINSKDSDGKKGDSQAMPGLRFGFSADVPLSSAFYLQPGIFYAVKGFKAKSWAGFGDIKAKANYIDLPINVIFKSKAGPGKLLVGAGPYISYGIDGSWKSDYGRVVGDIVVDNKTGDVVFKSDAANAGSLESYNYGRPWDYGANILVGYELWGNFSVQLTSMFGVANLTPGFNGQKLNGSLKNNSWGVLLSYKL